MNSEKRSNDKVMFLLWGTVILFVSFLVVLSFNVRLCSDDLFQLDNFIEEGWLDSVINFQSNVRWSSFLLFNSIFAFNEKIETLHWNLFFYYIVLFTGLFGSLSFLIRIVLQRFANIICSVKHSLLLAGFFGLTLFFSTSEPAEVWFWTGATTIYLVPVIFFIFGCALILSEKNNLSTYFLLLISFLYIGGAVETFALIVVFLLSLLLLLSYRKNPGVEFSRFRKKNIVSLVSVLILLTINFTSHRIVTRYTFESANQYFDAAKELNRIIENLSEPRNLVVIISFLVISIIGSIYRENGLIIRKINLRKFLLVNGLILLAITGITYIPLIFTFHGLGPERSWFPFNFFVVGLLFFLSFYIGNVYLSKIKTSRIVQYCGSAMLLVLIVLYCFKQFPMVGVYASQYDQRVKKMILLQKKGNTQTVFFSPLSDSGMIASLELGTKPDKQNEGLKVLLNLDYDVFLIDSTEKKDPVHLNK